MSDTSRAQTNVAQSSSGIRSLRERVHRRSRGRRGRSTCRRTATPRRARRQNSRTAACCTDQNSCAHVSSPPFGGQQHERLQEHPEVGPLRRPHPAVDEAEQSRRRAEEVAVLGELREPPALSSRGIPSSRVHLLAEREPVGAVRLPQARRIDVVLERGGGLRVVGHERAEPGHRVAVDHVDAPRLDVATARRPGGEFEELARASRRRPDRGGTGGWRCGVATASETSIARVWRSRRSEPKPADRSGVGSGVPGAEVPDALDHQR